MASRCRYWRSTDLVSLGSIFEETDATLIICTVAVATRLTRDGIASGATGAATRRKGRSAITDKCKRRFNHQEQGGIRVNGWRDAHKYPQPGTIVDGCAETLQTAHQE
jgi:hypothetical protein